MAIIIWQNGMKSGLDSWPLRPQWAMDGLGEVIANISTKIMPSKYWVQILTEDDAVWL